MKNLARKISIALAAVGCVASLAFAASTIEYARQEGKNTSVYKVGGGYCYVQGQELVGYNSSTFTTRYCSCNCGCGTGAGQSQWEYRLYDGDCKQLKYWSSHE